MSKAKQKAEVPTLMEVLVQTQERLATLESRVQDIEDGHERVVFI